MQRVIFLAFAIIVSTAAESQTLTSAETLTATVRKADVDAVRDLIAQGAQVNSKDGDGFSPLVCAVLITKEKTSALAIIELLLKAGAKIEQRAPEIPLDAAARFGSIEVVKYLLDKGADVNAGATDGRTPLYHSIRRARVTIADVLIQHGANVSAKSEEGWAPLHMAALNGMESTVGLLLKKGSDVNVRDREGKTPLAWAKGNGPKDLFGSRAKPELIEFMIKNGATE